MRKSKGTAVWDGWNIVRVALKMCEKNLILFDYDGVIADSLQHNVKIARECGKKLGFEFFPPLRDIQNMENMTFEDLGDMMGLSKDENEAFTACIFGLLTARVEMLSVFPGIHGLLKSLSRDHILAVLTTNREESVGRFLARQGLSGYISKISGSNREGSKSEKAGELMESFSMPKERVYLIGDTISDIVEARKAGVKSIAVTWGFQEKEQLLSRQPDLVVNSPGEIEAFFITRSINSNC
jgi:phosphoglycolate phosphatase